MNDHTFWISLLVFLPALSTLVIACLPKDQPHVLRWVSLAVTAITFLLSLYIFLCPASEATYFEVEQGTIQSSFVIPWIPSFDIFYSMGVDGISLPLVILTTLVSLLAMGASWSITKHVKAYCILFLILETAMLGVFLTLDFFLFFVFWEVMLLPMYFLIGVWGGPRREYAAIKFFLYTLVGGVLMLIAILMLYFKSDMRELAAVSDELGAKSNSAVVWADLHVSDDVTERLREDPTNNGQPLHTFNLLALAAMGQHTEVFSESWQWWAFLLLFIGFIIKVPSVPVHTWLPDAHVEAPTPISMILAGVLLKMGGYGIIRICYPICPHGGYDLAILVCAIGVISMVYGGFAALAQTDFKRMVAYSSVSHMGYVVLGLGVWSAWAGTAFNSDYWNMGVKGAMFQMIAHGISSAGMFFMVGVVYDRVHHRDLNQFGGLFGRMPVYTTLSIGIFFAALGLPGLCGFIGEVFVVLSVWKFNITLAVISASVVILTAAYILWAIQRVYLGPEYLGPHGEALVPSTRRENSIAGVLFVLAILLGVFPQTFVLQYMDKTIDRQVDQLTEWTRTVKQPALAESELDEAQASELTDEVSTMDRNLAKQPPLALSWSPDRSAASVELAPDRSEQVE
jgi:NADH-quinone oxidoreductase subunit M